MDYKLCNNDLHKKFEVYSQSKKLTQYGFICFYRQVLQPLYLMRIFLLLLLTATILLWSGMNRINAAILDETIRIAIVKSAAEVTVSGDGLLVTNETGSPLVMSFPAKVKSLKNGLLVEGRLFRKLSFSASSAVYVNNKPYRGLAELSITDKGILVVNQDRKSVV